MPACPKTYAAMLSLAVLLLVTPGVTAYDGAVVVKAGRVDLGDGTSIVDGMMLIEDGLISAVGRDVAVPEGSRVIELSDGVVTPGLIDANATITQAKRGLHHSGHPTAGEPSMVADILTGRRRPVHTCGTPGVCTPPVSFPCCGDPNPYLGGFAVGTQPRMTVSEGVSEIVPYTRVIDSIDLAAPDFARLGRWGVTTVFVTPDSGSVIGARGAIVKTGGPAAGRVVSAVDAVKAAMGRDPIGRGGYNRMPRAQVVTHRTRRPNTRMGVAWVFRKALFEAQAAMAGEQQIGGADTPPEEAMAPLMGILDGTISLRVHARKQMDILTALRLADEFNLRFTLEEGIEAYRCAEALKARDIPVIFGPIFVAAAGYRAHSSERFEPKLGAVKALLDAGLRLALTASEMRDEEGLAAQAAYAMRCGLDYQQALAAVTSQPAQILGIDDQVGTLAKGKSADLILWSGEPFASTTRIETVLIGGDTVYQAK